MGKADFNFSWKVCVATLGEEKLEAPLAQGDRVHAAGTSSDTQRPRLFSLAVLILSAFLPLTSHHFLCFCPFCLSFISQALRSRALYRLASGDRSRRGFWVGPLFFAAPS